MNEVWDLCKRDIIEAANIIKCGEEKEIEIEKRLSLSTPRVEKKAPTPQKSDTKEKESLLFLKRPPTYEPEELPSPLIKPKPIPDSLSRLSQEDYESDLDVGPFDEYDGKDLGSELLFLQLANNEDEEEDEEEDYTTPQDFPEFESPVISPLLSRQESGRAMQQLLNYDGSNMRSVLDSYLGTRHPEDLSVDDYD